MTAERWSQIRELLHELLEQDPQQRAATLARAGSSDPELRSEAESLLACEAEVDQALGKTVGAATGLVLPGEHTGPSLGAYRLVRQLGQGGMGVVWLGERDDGQFKKSVAIKLLPRLYMSTTLEARFLRERQILAQMEHPNIARLLDGGVSAEGQPYLVMEYVDGVPLTDWAREHKLNTDARIRLFLEVCSAVSYVHRNLIVHRDLKPGNILVDREGTVKLLDFGLARILERTALDLDLTQTALPMMTPAYASPEQALGKPVSAASDVFSLGVILYELLSGGRPFADGGQPMGEVLRAVCEMEASPPSSVPARSGQPSAKRLKGDLDNIILKALEKDPDRRYASVDALAQDLRFHAEGRPVTARRAGWMYRAGKFVRRNRLAVGIAAAAVIAVATGAGTALREGQRAERRFNDVRRLAHSVIFDLHDAIANLPGSTPARELLVRQGLEYLDNLSRESGGDVGLQKELAEGYLRLGTVQGLESVANLGETARASASMQKAVALLEQARKTAPADRDLALRLSSAYYMLALAGRQNAAGGSRELVQRSLAIAESDLQSNPGDRRAILNVCASENYLAGLERNAGRNQEAVALFRKILARYESLLSADPKDATALHDSSVVRKRMGATLIVLGSYEEALGEYARALEIDRAAAQLYPGRVDTQLDPTYAMTDMALAFSKLGRLEEALKRYREALEIRRRLELLDPKNARVKASVGSSLSRVAGAESRWADELDVRKRHTEAVLHWQLALDLYLEKEKRVKLDDEERGALSHVRSELATPIARRGKSEK